MRKQLAVGGLVALILTLAGCVGGGYGVGVGYDEGFDYDNAYPFGFYEPYGYYGGWGDDYFVGPPVRGGYWHRGPHGGRPFFHPGRPGHFAPSIPTGPRGGFHGGGRGNGGFPGGRGRHR